MLSIRKRPLLSEITFTTSRSSGAGGQHVNKTSSKVEMSLSLNQSQCLTNEEKERLAAKLKSHLTADGILRISCEETRSQHQNKERAIEKCFRLLERALIPDKVRRPTQPSLKTVLENKKQKQQKSALKTQRRYRPEL
ncbi:MAG: alternative ribosome rescue aminoacyl-tRNA hydrolase ArfB [Chitinophagales bacterium]